MDNLEQEKRIRREKSEKVRKWKGSWGHCLVPALLPANKFQFPKLRTSLLTSSWIPHVSLGWGGFRFICSLVCRVFRVFFFFLQGVRPFLFVLPFETMFRVAQMTSDSVCGRWWLWPSYPPASISQVLGSQAWDAIGRESNPGFSACLANWATSLVLMWNFLHEQQQIMRRFSFQDK